MASHLPVRESLLSSHTRPEPWLFWLIVIGGRVLSLSEAVKRKVMKHLFALVLLAAAVPTSIEPAHAQKRAKGASPPSSSAATECFKKNGGAYDAAKNRWVLYLNDESTFRLDAVRK